MTFFKQRQRWLRIACVVLMCLVVLYYAGRPRLLRGLGGSSSPPTHEYTDGFHRPNYIPGVAKSPTELYTRTLVIARTTVEDVSWIGEHLSGDASLSTAIYTVNETSPSGPFTVPKNKGHEAMPYLTYIIDHYEDLTDVTMFMHAHQVTWHNNDLLGSDAARMVSRLSSARVIREGYMNMRCHHKPGCPGNLHPLDPTIDDSLNYPETLIMGQAWAELFPGEPIPETLSQACCAQFALSRERIHALPLKQYIFFRDWLLNTPLEDNLAGRVWEYVWQYVWAGVHEFCPSPSICYCDGYGVCFGGAKEYEHYFERREERARLEEEGVKLQEGGEHSATESVVLQRLHIQVDEVKDELETLEKEAFERGDGPRYRAFEAGRPWEEGDGF